MCKCTVLAEYNKIMCKCTVLAEYTKPHVYYCRRDNEPSFFTNDMRAYYLDFLSSPTYFIFLVKRLPSLLILHVFN
jgi:hypothetical protein